MDTQTYCPKCNKRVAHNQKYCHSCGTRLNPQSSPNVQKPQPEYRAETVDDKPAAQPVVLLDNNAGMRKGKVGLPSKVQAVLFQDHIELYDKYDELILNAPLRSLTKANIKGAIIIFTADEQYYSLDFTPLARRMAFGAFGGLGAAVGSVTNPATKIAQTWALTMEKYGVRF